MVDFRQISVPTLVVDKERCERNIRSMHRRAELTGTILRPHFKTHQSHMIGSWMRDSGVERIACSSFRMAEYFALAGWDDITVAFPVNLRELPRINALSQTVKLTLLIDDPGVIDLLEGGIRENVNVMIELDVGGHRTGIPFDSLNTIGECITRLKNCQNLRWTGFLAHAGHTYDARDISEIETIHTEAISRLKAIRHYLSSAPHDETAYISYGDTPSCSKANSNWEVVDEMRPGNYVFFDLMQAQIGACDKDDIAVALICPVVSVKPDDHKVVVYGGGIHFSKDFIFDDGGKRVYGELVKLNGNTWEVLEESYYLRSLSQEHGVAEVRSTLIHEIKPGDLLGFLPVHSCMTAQCMGQYLSSTGEQLDHFAGGNNHSASFLA